MIPLLLLAVLGWIGVVQGVTLVTLEISEQVIAPDCFPRNSVVVNGTLPGPTLRFTEGDHIFINVINNAQHNVTIHWHGLSQRGSPFSDGTPESQYPIKPGDTFIYEFLLQNDAGTFFYHSHIGMQASSCFGVIVVEPANGTYPFTFDEERIVALSDCWHASDDVIEAGLLSPQFTFPGEPQNLLVNGKQLNATANGGEYTCPYDVIDVEPSKTYLFRFVGAQGLTYLRYTLAGHSFTTVQVDGGSYTKPLEVDHIEFGTGQRYAALLTTKSVEELNGQTVFWANISSFFRPIVDEGYALLRYNLNNDTSLPSEAFAIADATKYNIPQVAFSTFGWIDSQLQPLTSDPYPTTVDQRIVLNAWQVNGTYTGLAISTARWDINLAWFQEQNPLATPALVTLYKSQGTPAISSFINYTRAAQFGGYDPVSNIYPIKINTTIEIIFQIIGSVGGALPDLHPWHVHGQNFYDMGVGAGQFTEDAYQAQLSTLTPIQRDTTIGYAQESNVTDNYDNNSQAAAVGWRAVRFTASNPGVWMIHCHILPHMIMGMQTIFVMGGENLPLLPAAYANAYLDGGNFPQWNNSEVELIDQMRTISYFGID